MRIYLVGYMYSGKSTVGRRLAQALGMRFLDTDTLFEERYHTTIPLFFHRYDEAAFRRLEQQVLHTTAATTWWWPPAAAPPAMPTTWRGSTPTA